MFENDNTRINLDRQGEREFVELAGRGCDAKRAIGGENVETDREKQREPVALILRKSLARIVVLGGF